MPLDRWALSLILGLLVAIVGLILLGDHTVPKVKDFSWQNRQIGAEDRAFTLTFNRPMTWEKVQPNLEITPALEGKVSWSGRRMAYTLENPIAYGQSFQLKLTNVPEQTRGPGRSPKLMQPFVAQFSSRDRAFVYLGTDAQESGRLILQNLSTQTKTVLTPENLVVSEFKPFPFGDRILFSAADKNQSKSAFNPKLFSVTTGLEVHPPSQEALGQAKAGQIQELLDNETYQILKYDLGPEGETIVLQRARRSAQGALGQVSLWKMSLDGPPQEIQSEPGGDFKIAPDGQSLVMAQGQGLAVLPLKGQTEAKPLDFLPEFGNLLSFSADGTKAAVVKFNNDFTRSLFLVTNQGQQQELARLKGGVLAAQFDPHNQRLYCLLTQVINDQDYEEQPYLAVIEIDSRQITKLLDLPIQPNITMSLAPDATAILFDQVLDTPADGGASSGVNIRASNLWMLPLTASAEQRQLTPVKLTMGAVPRWLP